MPQQQVANVVSSLPYRIADSPGFHLGEPTEKDYLQHVAGRPSGSSGNGLDGLRRPEKAVRQ